MTRTAMACFPKSPAISPRSDNSSIPPNFKPMNVLVVDRLKSLSLASSVMISESSCRISSLSLCNMSVCMVRFLFSGLILFSFFSAESALAATALRRRFSSSSPSSRVRMDFICSRMSCPCEAYCARELEKCAKIVVEALSVSYVVRQSA